MSDKPKAKPRRRPRGAAALWLGVALLGLVYLGIWSADRTPGRLPQHSAGGSSQPVGITLPDATKQALTEQVKAAAATRTPGAQLEVIQTEEVSLEPGADLRQVPNEIGQRGLAITLGAVRSGKLSERLVYHALPPNQIVFVSEEPAQ